MEEHWKVFVHIGFFVSVTCVETAISVAGIEMTGFKERQFAMKTRMFGGIGVMALALTLAIVGVDAYTQQTQAAEKKAGQSGHHAMMQDCAKICSDCQRACDMCATHCANLLAEGKKEHLACLLNCQDCATCCAACSQVCARSGPQSGLMADCCAKCCDQCAKACEAFPDDSHMKACAEECRKCEKSCNAIEKQVASK